MTVRLLCAYGQYPANAIVTLDAGTEAGLVAAKMADTNLSGGVAYVAPPAPAPRANDGLYVLNAAGTRYVGRVEPDGTVTSIDPSNVNIGGGSIGGVQIGAITNLQRGLVGTLACLGDSRESSVAYSFTAGGQLQATLPRFVMHWLSYYLGAPWKHVQASNFAVPGTRTDEWATGHAAILALATPPDWVFIGFPTNDVQQPQNITTAQTLANLERFCKDYKDRGIRVILSTGGCNQSNTSTKWAATKQINDWIRAKALACNHYLVDTMTPIADPVTGQMASGYGTDGTHENALAAQKQATFNAPQFLHEARRGGSRFQRANLWETAAYNPTAAGNSTGNPTFWSSFGTAGTRTKVTRTDIPGEFAQVVFTSASDTEESGWQQTINLNTLWAASTARAVGARVKGSYGDHWVCTTAGTNGATEPAAFQAASIPGDTVVDGAVTWTRIATIVPGVSRISIAAEIQVSGSGGAQPRLYGTFGGAAGDLTFFRAMSPVSPDVSPPITSIASDITPALMTPTVLVPADATSLTVIVAARVANGIAGTVQMGRVLIDVA